MPIPVVPLVGALALVGGAMMFGRKSSASPGTVTPVRSGSADPHVFSWRVLSRAGKYFGQFRYPQRPGFAVQWVDVPEGGVLTAAEAETLARAQMSLAATGAEVLDNGVVTAPDGAIVGVWRVVRSPQGLYLGQYLNEHDEWTTVGQAPSPYYARLLVLEAFASPGGG